MVLLKYIISGSLDQLKLFIYHNFHLIGNFLGLKCRGCKHGTKSHTSIERGVWICEECKENNGVCEINTEETWEISLSIANALKNLLNNLIW